MGSENARRVLLCEDEADLADHLANYLQMHGFEARICSDGRAPSRRRRSGVPPPPSSTSSFPAQADTRSLSS